MVRGDNGYAGIVWQGFMGDNGFHDIFYRMMTPAQETGGTISSANPPLATTSCNKFLLWPH